MQFDVGMHYKFWFHLCHAFLPFQLLHTTLPNAESVFYCILVIVQNVISIW